MLGLGKMWLLIISVLDDFFPFQPLKVRSVFFLLGYDLGWLLGRKSDGEFTRLGNISSLKGAILVTGNKEGEGSFPPRQMQRWRHSREPVWAGEVAISSPALFAHHSHFLSLVLQWSGLGIRERLAFEKVSTVPPHPGGLCIVGLRQSCRSRSEGLGKWYFLSHLLNYSLGFSLPLWLSHCSRLVCNWNLSPVSIAAFFNAWWGLLEFVSVICILLFSFFHTYKECVAWIHEGAFVFPQDSAVLLIWTHHSSSCSCLLL